MKAIEFQSELSPEQTLKVPDKVAQSIPGGKPIRVLILVPDDESEQEWENLAAAEFGMGYADSDAIYDKLSSR
jgi:hypothetical protein